MRISFLLELSSLTMVVGFSFITVAGPSLPEGFKALNLPSILYNLLLNDDMSVPRKWVILITSSPYKGNNYTLRT
ncbi:hypothetical protein F5Y16DRAFT_375172, partial [Xylariaceae sp. FL0255]